RRRRTHRSHHEVTKITKHTETILLYKQVLREPSSLRGFVIPQSLPGLRRVAGEHFALLADDDPVRALLLVHVEALAVVAAHAFRRDDLRSANRAPLAGLLANLARLTFRPALDAEHGQVRQQTEKRADGTQEAAIEISD